MKAISGSFKKLIAFRPPSLLRDHFGELLSVFAATVSGIATYFLVTSFQLSLDAQRVAIQAQKTASDITKQNTETAQMLEKMSREARSGDMTNAADHQKWVKDMQGTDSEKIHLASVSLALGGAKNIPAIVAALLDPSQPHGDKVKSGLRIASLIDPEAVCLVLNNALRVAEDTTQPSVTKAQEELHCPPNAPVNKK